MRGELPLECREYGEKKDASFQVIVLVSSSSQWPFGTGEGRMSL